MPLPASWQPPQRIPLLPPATAAPRGAPLRHGAPSHGGSGVGHACVSQRSSRAAPRSSGGRDPPTAPAGRMQSPGGQPRTGGLPGGSRLCPAVPGPQPGAAAAAPGPARAAAATCRQPGPAGGSGRRRRSPPALLGSALPSAPLPAGPAGAAANAYPAGNRPSAPVAICPLLSRQQASPLPFPVPRAAGHANGSRR